MDRRTVGAKSDRHIILPSLLPPILRDTLFYIPFMAYDTQ
jgi:hypothetical protein